MENLEYNLAILKSEKENTQFALDRDLAGAIFVLKHENNREKEKLRTINLDSSEREEEVDLNWI